MMRSSLSSYFWNGVDKPIDVNELVFISSPMWSINLLPGKSRVSRILMDDVFPKVMGPFTPKQQVIKRIWSSKTQGAK
ncbi:hypothetical protein OGAPHI_000573 [Ogataea philodendri]|uniref:Uncharacterized protein n=1 Tax=Ogataea philodendri TaxID=1378263 RepID=A0A9P8PFW7_9ASCO|nr:uncharacterized protein OGAPHI_000573 [Ogataea philodendri]KAH3671186.1 hypothetical protein OGAPHI_000573 [Ogataea philodendri]